MALFSSKIETLFLRLHPISYPNKKTFHFLLKSFSISKNPNQNPTMTSSSSSFSLWACKSCTFLNPPSQKSSCQICLTPSSLPPSPPPSQSTSSSPLKWSCKACTFLNPYGNTSCHVCDTRAPVSSLSCSEDLNDTGVDAELDSSVGSVFLPLKACSNKRKARDEAQDYGGFQGFRGTKDSIKVLNVKERTDFGAAMEETSSGTVSRPLKVLTYNVWFREDLELHKRMKAIGDLIQLHSPDVICLQEVTPDIYDIFRQSSWWKAYKCSLSKEIADSRAYFCMQLSKLPVKSFSNKPFKNSSMGRELCIAEVQAEDNKQLVIATTHLESPCPGPPKWDQMFSKERVEQAKAAVNLLKNNHNVIFCGDMNWDDKLDGQFPIPDEWIDAWNELKPGNNGWTYDTKSNQMLTGNRTLQKRLDRVLCHLHDFEVSAIEMIGTEVILGLSYQKEKKLKKEIKLLDLPVLPSDHYGLLLTISRK